MSRVHNARSSTGRTGLYPGGLGYGSGRVLESTVLVGDTSVEPPGESSDPEESVGEVGDEVGVDCDASEEEGDDPSPSEKSDSASY